MTSEKRETVQVTVRIPPDLHRAMRRITFERDTSIQAEVEDLIVKYVAHHTKEKA
jgi:hypothetical protein